MGKPVDKSVERPFYFTKAPQTLTHSGATVAYPPETKNYHFEMELVLAIGAAGFRVKAEAHTDLRLRRRPGHDPARPATGGPRQGPPLGPGQGRGAVVGVQRHRADARVIVDRGAIALEVNGETKQRPTWTS
jgi:fumarylpyruvate hydrolase